MDLLQLYAEYSREEAHAYLSPQTEYSPQAGTWGLQGVVPIAGRPGDYAFFVTFGKSQGTHVFDEGITKLGVLTWQSQPSQSLADKRVIEWISHDPSKNSIHLFLRTDRNRRYAYLGLLAYLSHDLERECPVYFKWQILHWAMPEGRRKSIELRYNEEDVDDDNARPASTWSPSAAVGKIKLSLLPEAFCLSRRLENWLRRAVVDGELPVETVGEYQAAYLDVERTLLRSWGMGRKSASELTALVKQIASAGEQSASLEEFGKQLGLSPAALLGLFPHEGMPRDTPTEDLRSTSELQTEDFLSEIEHFRDMPFPECLKTLPISVRLTNALVFFVETFGSTWSLAEVLADYSHFVAILQSQPNVGRKSLAECSQVLCALVISKLVDGGYSANRAEEIGRRLCKLVPSQSPSTLPENLSGGNETPQELMAKLLSRLDDRSREIIKLRYGLNGPSKTLEEVGAVYDVTRERIRQLEKKALGQLAREARAIKWSLKTHGKVLWSQMSGGAPLVLKVDLGAAARKLSGDAVLAVDIGYSSVEAWLSDFAVTGELGWFADTETKAKCDELATVLKDAVEGRVLPIPLSNILPRETDLTLAIAVTRGIGRSIHLGYATATKAGVRTRRTIQLHRILSRHWPASQALIELTKDYRSQHPDDQCSGRDAIIVMEEAPHLFLHVMEDHWSTLMPSSLDISAHDADRIEADDEESIGTGNEHDQLANSVVSGIERVLEAEGPTRFADLRERALKFAPKGTSITSFGPILLTSGLFIRIAPGIYALSKHLASVASGEVLPAALFAPDQCRWFAQAMRAGSTHGEFPAWNTRFEFELCRWAEEKNVDPILFESLLAVIQPAKWPIVKGDQEYWSRLKTRKAMYRLDQPVPRLLDSLAPLSQLMTAAQRIIAEGSINWMSMNRVLGKRIDSSGSASALAILVAANVLKAAKHWQDPHYQSVGAKEFFLTLAATQEREGKIEWSLPVGQRELDACIQGAGSGDLGWVDGAELGDLLAALSAGKEAPATQEEEDGDEPNALDELLMARRVNQRTATARALVHQLTDVQEDVSQ